MEYSQNLVILEIEPVTTGSILMGSPGAFVSAGLER